MHNQVRRVYSNLKKVIDPETGEFVDGKSVVGETIAPEYCIYGSCYTSVCKEVLKFEPISTWHILSYLMFHSKINTNEIDTSNSLLQKELRRSKSDISRCLSVLRASNIIVEHDGKEYINPLVWFRGDYEHRVFVYNALGQPPFILQNSFYRREFRI